MVPDLQVELVEQLILWLLVSGLAALALTRPRALGPMGLEVRSSSTGNELQIQILPSGRALEWRTGHAFASR